MTMLAAKARPWNYAFPKIVSSASTVKTIAGDGGPASTAVTMPSGLVAGNLLLVIAAAGYGSSITATAGWTKLGGIDTSEGQSAIFWKMASGSDTLTLTSTTGSTWTVRAYQIKRANFISGSSGTFSPWPVAVSHTPSPANKQYLFFTMVDANGNYLTGPPSGWTGYVEVNSDRQYMSVAYKERCLGAQSPGEFARSSSVAGGTWTIAVFNNP